VAYIRALKVLDMVKPLVCLFLLHVMMRPFVLLRSKLCDGCSHINLVHHVLTIILSLLHLDLVIQLGHFKFMSLHF
jgi:hypothetical protein